MSWREATITVPPSYRVDRSEPEFFPIVVEAEPGVWFVIDADSGNDLDGPFSTKADAEWERRFW